MPDDAQPGEPAANDLHHEHVTVNGVGLNYVRAGQRGRPAIVLLHGFPQSWRMWRYVLPALAAEYDVIAPDLRGYGDSAKPAGAEGYDKGTMAADIRALVEHLRLTRPLLAGHDRGARVARRYALEYPDALVGAALLDILPVEFVYDRLSAAEAAAKYWHWIFHIVPQTPELLIAGHEAAYLERFFTRSPGLLERLRADGTWDEYLRAFLQPGAVAAALNDYRATYAIDLPRYRAERLAGRRIAPPLLLLWGSRGNLADQPVLEAWREVADDVCGDELPDCGHYLAEERPQAVAARLLTFAHERFS